MTFNYRTAVPMSTVPQVSDTEMAAHLRRALSEGWRLLALLALPEAAGRTRVGLCCILAHDATGSLSALRTPPLQAFASMTPHLPQAHLFEREIHEQWGLVPQGHPWLKSVRHIPDAAEAQARNMAGAETADAASQPTEPPYPFYRVGGGEVHEVAVGPVHAGVIEPGHFRFQCYGENVLHLEIALGYQHRGMEDMIVRGPLARCLPLLECAAGDTTVGHATAHCVLLERIAAMEVSPRAQVLRRIGLELERLANHAGDLGAIAGDTGFLPTASWNGRIRGDFLNITASLCGNRFGRGLLRAGGTAYDLNPAECADMLARVRAAGRDVRGAVDVMLHEPSVHERLAGTGVVSRETATQLGLVGMAARGCGLDVDARFYAPLSDLPCEGCAPCVETSGDVLARTLVRSREVDDSLRLLERDITALAAMPAGHASSHAPEVPPALPADTLAVAQVEGWRGEISHVAVTGSDGHFLAYKVVDPSFHNWPGLAMALRGNQISDFPLCNKSFNLSYCGHDL